MTMARVTTVSPSSARAYPACQGSAQLLEPLLVEPIEVSGVFIGQNPGSAYPNVGGAGHGVARRVLHRGALAGSVYHTNLPWIVLRRRMLRTSDENGPPPEPKVSGRALPTWTSLLIRPRFVPNNRRDLRSVRGDLATTPPAVEIEKPSMASGDRQMSGGSDFSIAFGPQPAD